MWELRRVKVTVGEVKVMAKSLTYTNSFHEDFVREEFNRGKPERKERGDHSREGYRALDLIAAVLRMVEKYPRNRKFLQQTWQQSFMALMRESEKEPEKEKCPTDRRDYRAAHVGV